MSHPLTIAEVTALARSMPRYHRYSLRCGATVLDALRSPQPPLCLGLHPEPSPPEAALAAMLLGITVIEAPELGAPRWELREDDRLISQGSLSYTKEA